MDRNVLFQSNQNTLFHLWHLKFFLNVYKRNFCTKSHFETNVEIFPSINMKMPLNWHNWNASCLLFFYNGNLSKSTHFQFIGIFIWKNVVGKFLTGSTHTMFTPSFERTHWTCSKRKAPVQLKTFSRLFIILNSGTVKFRVAATSTDTQKDFFTQMAKGMLLTRYGSTCFLFSRPLGTQVTHCIAEPIKSFSSLYFS